MRRCTLCRGNLHRSRSRRVRGQAGRHAVSLWAGPACVARLALDLAVVFLVLLAAAVGRCGGRGTVRLLGPHPGRRCPPGNLPDLARKGLELEAAPMPFAAGFAGSVEGTKAGIDGAETGLGSEFVDSVTGLTARRCIRIQGAIVAR